MEWLIAAGLHPRATATTLRVAHDLADRMGYDTGHVRYCLSETAARLALSEASLKRHVKYLRELGALAWVQHGTRTNIRSLMGLKGYAATATVYAAVIPAAYDHAMGHQIIGTGYTARIIVDLRKRPKPVDNSPVDNSSSTGLEPPSLAVVKEEDQVQMGGGFNYTPRKSASQRTASIPHQQTSSNSKGRRTAADVASGIQTVRLVRALVNWTQKVPLRRLEYVLRPWTDRGWDAYRIVDELNGMCAGVRWRPKRADQFIRARITQQDAHDQALADAVAWKDSTAARELAGQASLAALFAPAGPAAAEPERTDEDRLRARMNWNVWPDVIAHYEDDPDDALDLYGLRLCKYAIGQDARTASYSSI